jgi:threonine dehydrogenase-like Zn-dependent dehydrogenase
MHALVTEPAVPHSTRVEDVPEPTGDGVLLRVLEVGVCGTDREISEGIFGVPADGKSLVLGHESLSQVERDGHGFSKGDLVTATVRRSCHHCMPCDEGAPDSCLTGDYSERGITRLDGFARELVLEDPTQLIPIPSGLGRLGVLAEPTSICERAIRHSLAIGGRQPWQLERALVVGAGAIGVISTYLLRLAGLEVFTASLEPANDLVTAAGAQYVPTRETPLAELRKETHR